MTADLEQPRGYGRILRQDGKFSAIVEEKDATEEQRAIREINSGIYWFRTAFLLEALNRITCDNAAVNTISPIQLPLPRGWASQWGCTGLPGRMWCWVPMTARAFTSSMRLPRMRVLEKLMDLGVDIPFTDGVVISPDAVIGADTRILPGTVIKGKTRIGEGCEIGPNTELNNCRIGEGVRVPLLPFGGQHGGRWGAHRTICPSAARHHPTGRRKWEILWK